MHPRLGGLWKEVVVAVWGICHNKGIKRVGAHGYGMDLRERIVLAVREGLAVEEAAQQYWVHLQTVQWYLNLDDQGLLEVYVKPSGRPYTLQTEHARPAAEAAGRACSV